MLNLLPFEKCLHQLELGSDLTPRIRGWAHRTLDITKDYPDETGSKDQPLTEIWVDVLALQAVPLQYKEYSMILCVG
jgi:hypothetical protein